MSLFDSVKLAFWALAANKLRTVLTLLGIIIGVGSVIAAMSIGRGANKAIEDQISSIGTNLLFVRPQAQVTNGVRGQAGSGQTLTLQDANALSAPGAAPAIIGVAPELTTFAQARAGSQNTNTRITGTTESYAQVREWTVAEGRFITDQDVASRSLVIVLGSNTAVTLFGDFNSPIDQTVIINQRPFRVIGVLKSKGGTNQGLTDDLILAPITTVQQRLTNQRNANGTDTVQTINVQAANGKSVDAAKEQIRSILRTRHNIAGTDDFSITSQDDLVEARTQVTQVLTILLASTAGISLLVGGIGIMNIMLVSVTERTREIGIRKAVGAKRRDVLMQFLAEAIVVSIIGGALGIVAGWGTSKLLEHLELNNQRVQTLVTSDVAGLAVGVAVAIGLFFGIYPAVRASRMDPIEALRHS